MSPQFGAFVPHDIVYTNCRRGGYRMISHVTTDELF